MQETNLIQNEQKKKSIYRELFLKINNSFLERFNAEKPRISCKNCSIYSQNCKYATSNIIEKLPQECILRLWQESQLNKLNNQISKSIYSQLQILNSSREKYHCNCCASCCKLASSEYSYEELKERAKNGDIFAKQFTSVFIPYTSKKEARQFYPEFFDLLESKYKDDEKIYFYHCPKIDDNNLCSDYENRPDICRDFPNNPLVIFPKSCGYRAWQDEVDVLALTLHAMIEITDFYKEKIAKALSN